MSDVFLEKIVSRRKTGMDYLKIAGLLVATFVVLTLIMMFGGYVAFLLPFLVIGTFYGLWFMLSGMNREYEYIVTNGDLDIDMIIARRRRKRIFSGRSKDFEIMARVKSDEYKDAQRGRVNLIDCTSSAASPDNWFIVTDYKGQRTIVLFEPDERMLRNLKRFNPSKVKFNPTGPL